MQENVHQREIRQLLFLLPLRECETNQEITWTTREAIEQMQGNTRKTHKTTQWFEKIWWPPYKLRRKRCKTHWKQQILAGYAQAPLWLKSKPLKLRIWKICSRLSSELRRISSGPSPLKLRTKPIKLKRIRQWCTPDKLTSRKNMFLCIWLRRHAWLSVISVAD